MTVGDGKGHPEQRGLDTRVAISSQEPGAERFARGFADLSYFYSGSGPAATLADVLPAADDFHV